MVYLTPDADDVIEDIYPNKVYVIGGQIPITENYSESKMNAFDHI